MTISSTNRKAGPFAGNGVTTVFPFTYKVFAAADLRVIKTSTLGVNTDLVLTTNYTVALNADQNASPGGSVTALVAPATGEKLTIIGNLAALQPTALISGGGFYPDVIENALDRGVILEQQLALDIGRTLKFPLTDVAGINSELPAVALRANKALIFNPDGSVGVSVGDFDDQAAAAAASAAAAAASATSAAGSVTSAAASAASATSSATAAAASAGASATSASASATSAAASSGSATAAAASAVTAANLLDNFDDRYLGAKAVAPTLDNDGNTLLDGALYFNTTSKTMFVYDLGTTTWKTFTASTVRNGAGAPGGGLGADGDFYINTTNYDLYGPKTGGAWGTGHSLVGPTGPGSGDVIGPAASVDGEIVLFNSSTGKLIKRAAISGLAKLVSGVLSAAAAVTDYVAPGLIGPSGLTMNTARLLGRTTAAAGAVEELTIGSNLTLTGGVLDGQASGWTLLAVINPTAAAAVNALTTFTSTYDSYVVMGESICPASDAGLSIRLAVAGVLDTGSVYAISTAFSTTAATYGNSSMNVAPSAIGAAGGGLNFSMSIDNVNDATNLKSVVSRSIFDNASSQFVHAQQGGGYKGGVVTGFSIFWTGAVNFKAQGSIRIYGVKKA